MATVKITAIKNGGPVTFQIDGKDPQEVFRYWKTSKMSQGCTRGALGDKPAMESNAVASGEIKRRGVPKIELVTTTCSECGVSTTSIKDGNYVPSGNPQVHERGCTKCQPGDLEVAPEE